MILLEISKDLWRKPHFRIELWRYKRRNKITFERFKLDVQH